MARVLLINPSQSNVYGPGFAPPYPPLGLLTVASSLRAAGGHSLTFVDADLCLGPRRSIWSVLREVDPQWVLISASTPCYPAAVELATAVRRFDRGVRTVLGGVHATVAASGCDPEAFDFLVVGEGEQTIVDLLQSRGVPGIPGVGYATGGFQQVIPRPLAEDLDALPVPALDLVSGLGRYTPPNALRLPAVPVITSRGCPGQCTYCSTHRMFGRRFRQRSVENVLDEIQRWTNQFGAREIHLIDDNVSVRKRFMLEFCAAAQKRFPDVNFLVPQGMRADHFDRQIAEALARIHVLNVGFGVESGNQHILDRIGKGLTLDQFREAFALAREFGFETWGFFMVGLPGETLETMEDTLRFAMELDPDFAKFLILKPYPGTPVFEELEAAGRIDDRDWSHYGTYAAPVHSLPGLSKEEIAAFQQKAFRTFYLRPRKVGQHLRRMKSLDQLRANLRSASFAARLLLRP